MGGGGFLGGGGSRLGRQESALLSLSLSLKLSLKWDPATCQASAPKDCPPANSILGQTRPHNTLA